jgi:hypothetical protein
MSLRIQVYITISLLSLNVLWGLVIGPLLCKLSILFLFITCQLLPQTGSCILQGPKIGLGSWSVSRYLSHQFPDLILVLMIKCVLNGPPSSESNELAMGMIVMVIKPCSDFLRVIISA